MKDDGNTFRYAPIERAKLTNGFTKPHVEIATQLAIQANNHRQTVVV